MFIMNPNQCPWTVGYLCTLYLPKGLWWRAACTELPMPNKYFKASKTPVTEIFYSIFKLKGIQKVLFSLEIIANVPKALLIVSWE